MEKRIITSYPGFGSRFFFFLPSSCGTAATRSLVYLNGNGTRKKRSGATLPALVTQSFGTWEIVGNIFQYFKLLSEIC